MVKRKNYMSLIWHINRNSTYKGDNNNDLGNLNRKLKVREDIKGKGEVRLRKERKVIMVETVCIIRQIFSLPHITSPLLVISLGKVAILTYPPKYITLWSDRVIRLYNETIIQNKNKV